MWGSLDLSKINYQQLFWEAAVLNFCLFWTSSLKFLRKSYNQGPMQGYKFDSLRSYDVMEVYEHNNIVPTFNKLF